MDVLYFTAVPIATDGNGGSLCGRTNLRRLAEDPMVKLKLLAVGNETDRDGTLQFADELGIPARFLGYRDDPPSRPHEKLYRAIAQRFPAYFAPWEIMAAEQRVLRQQLHALIQADGSDVLVVEYLYSMCFLRLAAIRQKTVLINLNDETRFQRDLLSQKHAEERLSGRVSLMRVRHLERATLRRVDKVVSLSSSDHPACQTRSAPAVVTPYFDPSPRRWQYGASKACFFVGNAGHFPNALAMRWLLELAPRLLALDPAITITLLGAHAELFPGPHPENVRFVGYGDPTLKASLFLNMDVMLCPVENTFGVKFKCVEALAFGTPMLVSGQTLQGFPYLQGTPVLTLADPAASAETIAKLLNSREQLLQLQARQQALHDAFVRSQAGIWGRVLSSIPGVEGRDG